MSASIFFITPASLENIDMPKMSRYINCQVTQAKYIFKDSISEAQLIFSLLHMCLTYVFCA